jgi:hypothetical protein
MLETYILDFNKNSTEFVHATLPQFPFPGN